MNTYDYASRNDISKIAIDKITKHLFGSVYTRDIINVEDDKRFQELDIDLICVYKNGPPDNIEVKCDTYDSGNFFFETISNSSKGTEGCFMYTLADKLYYYFEKRDSFYILPMPETRNWFIENRYRFKEKELATRRGGKVLYYSYGYTVPIKKVIKEVRGVIEVNL